MTFAPGWLRRSPAFWFAPKGVLATMFSPFAVLYGKTVARRMAKIGQKVGFPVVCIGNFTMGGGGKTPLALAIADLLKKAGHKPIFLTRGYGGREKGPVVVGDPATLERFGDEALLLAANYPTIVSADRVAGAAAATNLDASLIVMDDGFQNPSLLKDCVLVAIDGQSGIGNGLCCPAGPMRAPLQEQLPYATALIVIGDGAAGQAVAKVAQAMSKPVFKARIVPDESALPLRGKKVLGFAGIARPEKFFATLAELGATVTARAIFPDHHAYTEKEAALLQNKAQASGLIPVTTTKDMVRLRGGPARERLASSAVPVPIRLAFEDEAQLLGLMLASLTRAGFTSQGLQPG